MKKLVLLMGLVLKTTYGLDDASMHLIDRITQQHLDMASNGLVFDLAGKRCRIFAQGGSTPNLQGRTLFCAGPDLKRAFMPDTLPLIVHFTDTTFESLMLCIDSKIEEEPLPERTQYCKRQADCELDSTRNSKRIRYR